MKPVYKSEKYYNVSVVYYNPDTNIKTELDPVRFTIFDSAQDYINTKLEEYKDEIGTTAVQLQEILDQGTMLYMLILRIMYHPL